MQSLLGKEVLKAYEQNCTRVKCKRVEKMFHKTEQQIEISDPGARGSTGTGRALRGFSV